MSGTIAAPAEALRCVRSAAVTSFLIRLLVNGFALWVATQVPNDSLVPILDARGITYQGIKPDDSNVALILGILTGLVFVFLIGLSYKRMNPVKTMGSFTRSRLRLWRRR